MWGGVLKKSVWRETSFEWRETTALALNIRVLA